MERLSGAASIVIRPLLRMLIRLLVRLVDFSRRHAALVVVGGVLLARVRRLGGLGPPGRQHRHRPAVQGHPALAAAGDGDEPRLPAVPRPAGRRGGCAHPRGSRRDRERTRGTAFGRQDAFPDRAPAGRQSVPGEGRAAVPAAEAAVGTDGPDHRRPAVPGPAGRRSVGPRPVLGAVAAGHGRDPGRRRPVALPRRRSRAFIRRWPMPWTATRSRCPGRPCWAAA